MTTALRYLPATDQAWLTLAAGHRVLVVEASAAASADRLFSGLATDASQAILDELTAADPALSPSFALVTLDVSEVTGLAALHCIVRGSATLAVETAGGSETVEGSTATTTVERSFSDVSAYSIGATDEASPSLPLESGAAWSTGVTWQATPAIVAEVAAAVQAEVQPAAETEVNDSTVVMGDRLRRPRASDVTPPESEVNDSTVVMDDRLKRPRVGAVPPLRPSTAKHAATPEITTPPNIAAAVEAEPTPEPTPASTPAPEPTPEPAAMPEPAPTPQPTPTPEPAPEAPDHTVVIDRAAPTPAPVVDDEHDGATVVVDRSALAAAKKPAQDPTAEPASAAPKAPSYYLSLSTGERAPLGQPVLVGRAPSVPKDASGPTPRLVAIPGDKDISRSHVRFAMEGDSIVVTDLHSRNGTSIALPGRSPQRLRGGEPTTVLVGTLVDLGNGITITLLEE